jgi:hypothetical protein
VLGIQFYFLQPSAVGRRAECLISFSRGLRLAQHLTPVT